ncbi:hypothetical protein [Nostoc linckia]|uniref:hypothetical protein n=1 Tax=Nostoc linckia TaxID=92942 RepID=UPI0015D50864|nr:hypothetical protein [Nostoc linckia]
MVVNLSLDVRCDKQGSVCQAINTSRHRFEKPIHNVKNASNRRSDRVTATQR